MILDYLCEECAEHFEGVKACLDAGMNSHIGKPLDMKVLIGEILKYTNAH